MLSVTSEHHGGTSAICKGAKEDTLNVYYITVFYENNV